MTTQATQSVTHHHQAVMPLLDEAANLVDITLDRTSQFFANAANCFSAASQGDSTEFLGKTRQTGGE